LSTAQLRWARPTAAHHGSPPPHGRASGVRAIGHATVRTAACAPARSSRWTSARAGSLRATDCTPHRAATVPPPLITPHQKLPPPVVPPPSPTPPPPILPGTPSLPPPHPPAQPPPSPPLNAVTFEFTVAGTIETINITAIKLDLARIFSVPVSAITIEIIAGSVDLRVIITQDEESAAALIQVVDSFTATALGTELGLQVLAKQAAQIFLAVPPSPPPTLPPLSPDDDNTWVVLVGTLVPIGSLALIILAALALTAKGKGKKHPLKEKSSSIKLIEMIRGGPGRVQFQHSHPNVTKAPEKTDVAATKSTGGPRTVGFDMDTSAVMTVSSATTGDDGLAPRVNAQAAI